MPVVRLSHKPRLKFPLNNCADKGSFYTFFSLPDDLVPTNQEVVNFIGRYVNDSNQVTSRFDWGGFKSAVDGYNGPNLAIADFFNTSIPLNDAEARVSTLVDKLMAQLPGILPGGGIDTAKLKDGLNASFQDLNSPLNADKPGSQQLTREFRAIVAVPNANLADHFRSAVATVTAEADIETQSSCFKITTSKNLKATINIMELEVIKGFKNPST